MDIDADIANRHAGGNHPILRMIIVAIIRKMIFFIKYKRDDLLFDARAPGPHMPRDIVAFAAKLLDMIVQAVAANAVGLAPFPVAEAA